MINEWLCRYRTRKILDALKKAGELPRNIELSHVKNVAIAAVYDQDQECIMQNAACTGVAISPDQATLKALVEFIERRAFIDGAKQGRQMCMTDSSDGFAAYPVVLLPRERAKRMARRNAWHEALERYVWATWWDHIEMENEFKKLSVRGDTPHEQLLTCIHEHVSVRELILIFPRIANAPNSEVIVVFAFLNGGGVVSGGAAGFKKEREHNLFRACSELVRHALGIARAKEQRAEPKTFYEKRLLFFGFGHGDELVRQRLSQKGSDAVTLPPLRWDGEVPHAFRNVISVHRCLFENQPPFVGGQLERLCL